MRFSASTAMAIAVLTIFAGSAFAQTAAPKHPLIGVFDTNGDGKLSAAEIDKAAAKLKSFDSSKDGQLTAEELRGKVRMSPRRSAKNVAPVENTPVPKDDAEKKVIEALKHMRQGPRYANVSDNDGRLLRMLVEMTDAKYVVEIGTSTGESGTWLAHGLRATGGKLITHELDPGRAKTAKANFKKAGVDDVVTIVMGNAHETVTMHKDAKQPIDILFLDADKSGYIDYLNKLVPLIRPGGLIVAHNMVYPKPDPAYLKAVTTDPKSETSFRLMEGAGMGVTLKKR